VVAALLEAYPVGASTANEVRGGKLGCSFQYALLTLIHAGHRYVYTRLACICMCVLSATYKHVYSACMLWRTNQRNRLDAGFFACVCLCMYVYVYCTYVYIYTYIYVHILIYIYKYIYIFKYIFLFIQFSVSLFFLSLFTCIYTCIYMHILIHIYTYVYMHKFVYTEYMFFIFSNSRSFFLFLCLFFCEFISPFLALALNLFSSAFPFLSVAYTYLCTHVYVYI